MLILAVEWFRCKVRHVTCFKREQCVILSIRLKRIKIELKQFIETVCFSRLNSKLLNLKNQKMLVAAFNSDL